MKNLSMMLLSLMATAAMASTTKVGNGDDGTDLEGAIRISSGPIFESRLKAVALLKTLNVQGITGLGQLLPELERTDLLMASQDVQALSSEGSWEASDDRRKVYARTFAEPHAPTRFFPATLSLNQDQLIALHTHEALHRALPPDVRENEEKVAILTMAITSPSATFDRVNQFAKTVINGDTYEPANVAAAGSSSTAIETSPPDQPAKSTEVQLHHTTHSGSRYWPTGNYVNVERLSGEFSPIGAVTIKRRVVEPRAKVEGTAINEPGTNGYRLGPLSLYTKAPVKFASVTAGPIAQLHLKSLERSESYSSFEYDLSDRDVYTVGAFVEADKASSFSSFIMTYTLGGKGQAVLTANEEGLVSEHKAKYAPIWSLYGREAYKWKKFYLGAVAELHHSDDNFTLLRAGPEIRAKFGRTTLGVGGMYMLNRQYASMADLGDIAGHGTGKHSASASIAVDL